MGFPFLLSAPRLAKCTIREYRIPVSSFRAEARNLFHSRSIRKSEDRADNGKHRTPCDVGLRCFMQTALRRERETGNEKDPSAALGMTKRGKAYLTFFFNRFPHPTSAPSGHLLPEEGGRYENAAFPVSSFRAKARNLFRLRSIKTWEDSG